MIDVNLLLGQPIPIILKDGTYSKKNFNGFFLQNYKLKDFLVPSVGYEKYMYWCSIITNKPKDIADVLLVKHNTYYKDINDWLFVFSHCYDPESGRPREVNDLFDALNFMLGYDYHFVAVEDERAMKQGKPVEDVYYINAFNNKGEWVAKIDRDNFESIGKVVKMANYIKPSELSSWNYAYERHEKKALRYYYEKRKNNIDKAPYTFTLETVLRFLRLETGIGYDKWLDESLYEIYSCYNMKTSTFHTLALHIGLYGGNVKMDGNVRNSLVFGAVHNSEKVEGVAKGSNLEGIEVEK